MGQRSRSSRSPGEGQRSRSSRSPGEGQRARSSRDHGEEQRARSSRALGESTLSLDLDRFSPPDMAKFGWIPQAIMSHLWSEDKEVVFSTLRQLGDLWDSNDPQTVEDRAAVYEAGGHFAIIAAMSKWYTCHRVTIDGLRALANIGANTPFRDASVKAGAFEVVVLSMSNFPDDEYVQRNACAALRRLCLGSVPNAIYFGLELDGWDAVVNAMAAFPDQLTLLDWAVSMLYEVSEVEQLKFPITQSGALRELASCSENFRGSDDKREQAIREQARVAMHRLVACD